MQLAAVVTMMAGIAALPLRAQEPVLEMSEWAQGVLESFPVEEQPMVVDGHLQIAEGGSWGEFGRRLIAAARQQGLNSVDGPEIFDDETFLYLGDAKFGLRLVLGRDGGANEGDAGADGTSIPPFEETRSDLILIVAGGNGGTGWGNCHPGGAGGNSQAVLSGKRGALLAFGGHAGSPGPHDCELPWQVDDPDWQPPTWYTPNPVGEAGAPGRNGGNAEALGTECGSAVQLAFGGNGGNGALPQRFGGRGGHGGDGGTATADCGSALGNGPCFAAATGGNAGNGANGRTSIAAGAVGKGGAGGKGGGALSYSCCGYGYHRLEESLAVAGAGGNGGNGGNSIEGAGGAGGDGQIGGWAVATQRAGWPGAGGGEALAVSGSGGNGGNGGNSGRDVGGAGGVGGFNGTAKTNTLECPGGPARKVKGVEGHAGRKGNGRP